MQYDELNDSIWNQSSSFKVHDDDVLELIEGYEQNKYVKVVESTEQLHEFVGTGVTYSDLLAITKQRFDAETKTYKKKTRTVLNLKKSGISRRTRLRHKGGLPRATDAISDILTLMDDALPEEVLEQLVMDIVDAFWIIPQ